MITKRKVVVWRESDGKSAAAGVSGPARTLMSLAPWRWSAL